MNDGHDTLTKREVDVLECIAEHPSFHEVAYQLNVSYNTVKWYTRQIYGKLDVNSREEAIKKAWGIGLLNEGRTLPHNLPAAMTEFVGRGEELKELSSLLLNDHHRLVTVLATGGMGKTRLALEAAHRLVKPGPIPIQRSDFSDGVFFVPLASLDASEYVLSAVAGALEFRFNEGPDPRQQLLDHLRDKNLLLILDNFEHVLGAVELVIEILRAAPRITLLVTSRERLKLNAETVYTLNGMTFPDTETSVDVHGYDSARLFMRSAQRIRRDFRPDPCETSGIKRICNMTGGMPLAIILAAAWLETLSVREIADEIKRNIDILRTEMRDIPERLHSVQAVFEAAWDRMTEAERGVFLRLSVFRDGCTREAAEQVADADIHVLQGLSNKAMITQAESGRYEIHELLRQFAENRLQQTAEGYGSVRDEHCAFFAELIAKWEWWNHTLTGYQGMKNTAEVEWDNITSAWSWAGKRGFSQRLWQLLYPIACVSWHRGWFQEAAWLHAEVIDEMEANEGVEKDALLLGTLHASHAYFCNYLDQAERVETGASRSLAHLQTVESHADHPEMVSILKALTGDLREASPILAREIAQELIKLCRTQGQTSNLVWAFFELAMVDFVVLGNTAEAKPVLEEALKMARQQEIANLTMHFTHLLGAVHYQEGDLQTAKRMACEALDLAQSIGDKLNSVTPLVLLGDIELKRGDFAGAQSLYRQALVGSEGALRRPRFALSLFAGIAESFASTDEWERAAELGAFVQSHPFRNAYWSPRERAAQMLDRLETSLPDKTFIAAKERGRALHIDEIFDQLLVQFAHDN